MAGGGKLSRTKARSGDSAGSSASSLDSARGSSTSSSSKRFDQSDSKVVGTNDGDRFRGETSGVGENALELGIDRNPYSGIGARCCGSGSEPSKKLVEANSE